MGDTGERARHTRQRDWLPFAAGILLGLLSIKLSILFVPPVFRAFVAVLRAPFNWIRNRCRRTGGGNV